MTRFEFVKQQNPQLSDKEIFRQCPGDFLTNAPLFEKAEIVIFETKSKCFYLDFFNTGCYDCWQEELKVNEEIMKKEDD